MWPLLLAVQEVAPEAVESWIPKAFDEPNEVGIWTLVLSLAVWMVRHWWIIKLERRESRRVEHKIENGWTSDDDTLTRKRNPGRTISELVELVHADLQQFKAETNQRFSENMAEANRRFDAIHTDIGKIKGKLDLD